VGETSWKFESSRPQNGYMVPPVRHLRQRRARPRRNIVGEPPSIGSQGVTTTATPIRVNVAAGGSAWWALPTFQLNGARFQIVQVSRELFDGTAVLCFESEQAIRAAQRLEHIADANVLGADVEAGENAVDPPLGFREAGVKGFDNSPRFVLVLGLRLHVTRRKPSSQHS
jgi:hypothetical protein